MDTICDKEPVATRPLTSPPTSHPKAQPTPEKAALSSTGEYLTFRLGGEEYGIDLLKVQEIRSYHPPTRIANAPAFIKGVLNLRGVIMPVVDLRMALGCDQACYDGFTVVVVLNVNQGLVGVVVDSVNEVLALPSSAIQPAPGIATVLDAGFIHGIATVHERTLVMMDIEELMAGLL